MYDDRIVFWNSGTLIAPLNVDLLKKKHPSKRRNALIANIFFRMGYIETWGRGILLMKEEMINIGMPEPIIEEYSGGFQITFQKGRLAGVEKSVEKSVEKIISLIKSNSYITQKELAKDTGLSRRGVEKNISILKKEGKIKRIGPAKGGHWEIIE